MQALMPRRDRRSILGAIDNWQKVVALVVLVLEAFLLAVLARSETVEWYVVLLGVTPLIAIIIGVFFGPKAQAPRPVRQERPDVAAKIEVLMEKLTKERFRPHLIIGLSRGGLIVAARLSHEFHEDPPVPVISLWPHLPDYDNASFSVSRRACSLRRSLCSFSTSRLPPTWYGR